MAFDRISYVLSKKYTDKSIEGTVGVLAGKNCQISSKEPISDGERTGTRITFTWFKDGETEARTTVMDVWNGEKGDKGEQGEKGEEGYSPEITIEEQSATEYKLRIKTGDTEFVTPNLKGSGGTGIDVHVEGDSLVFTY